MRDEFFYHEGHEGLMGRGPRSALINADGFFLGMNPLLLSTGEVGSVSRGGVLI